MFRNKSYLMLITMVFIALPLAAQESEMPMGPPPPLDDEMSKWLVGEWEGWTESTMGKTQDWMKVEFGLDGQFLVMNYRSKAVEIKPEMLKTMAEQMKISEEEARKMMDKEYQGMGCTTVNPQTGELVGFWVDSYRDISQGKGTREGLKSTMMWKSPMMEMERHVEKVSEDKMKVSFSGKDIMGNEFSGTSVMTRKK